MQTIFVLRIYKCLHGFFIHKHYTALLYYNFRRIDKSSSSFLLAFYRFC
ncbi:hypothetical protein SUBVAR_05452 [Subdoligranulum variabile DSM 15176]|uniref:Uncharacterized protein n=1 Tax=Subdoligranulum variabile DSM 15176 TaxID=411471 RepID=D1PM92_9FIRM|nr:hypothetical protein SUBVAR_05452 [Subdoligranulum variabile DSM 15176]